MSLLSYLMALATFIINVGTVFRFCVAQVLGRGAAVNAIANPAPFAHFASHNGFLHDHAANGSENWRMECQLI